jgi:hypothetical protein
MSEGWESEVEKQIFLLFNKESRVAGGEATESKTNRHVTFLTKRPPPPIAVGLLIKVEIKYTMLERGCRVDPARQYKVVKRLDAHQYNLQEEPLVMNCLNKLRIGIEYYLHMPPKDQLAMNIY